MSEEELEQVERAIHFDRAGEVLGWGERMLLWKLVDEYKKVRSALHDAELRIDAEREWANHHG